MFHICFCFPEKDEQPCCPTAKHSWVYIVSHTTNHKISRVTTENTAAHERYDLWYYIQNNLLCDEPADILMFRMAENEEDHADVSQGLKLVKEVIAAVDNKVNEHEKKKRLKEVYSRTDSKSIMRMKSGQMFAREDLLRGRKLIHDGPLQLKNSAGRLKGENKWIGFTDEYATRTPLGNP